MKLMMIISKMFNKQKYLKVTQAEANRKMVKMLQ